MISQSERWILLSRFHTQAAHAADRHIEFLFSFDEWLETWITSGKLHLRGGKKGCYVMARHNDVGPYAKWNVTIQLMEENSRDGTAGRIVSQETREKLRAAQLGKKLSAETKAKLSASRKGKRSPMKGHRHSEESKLKMSLSHQARPKTKQAKNIGFTGHIPWNKGKKSCHLLRSGM